ncbi:hypothetical protein HBB16_14080 [Pseudonocardia sp. MCCB 268]|nr:hypothetical protein [Pseudonocardia cytotoxica]
MTYESQIRMYIVEPRRRPAGAIRAGGVAAVGGNSDRLRKCRSLCNGRRREARGRARTTASPQVAGGMSTSPTPDPACVQSRDPLRSVQRRGAVGLDRVQPIPSVRPPSEGASPQPRPPTSTQMATSWKPPGRRQWGSTSGCPPCWEPAGARSWRSVGGHRPRCRGSCAWMRTTSGSPAAWS